CTRTRPGGCIVALTAGQRSSDLTAAQLFAAADRVPLAGPALPRLVLRGFGCQCCRHVKARGRLSERTLGGTKFVRFANCHSPFLCTLTSRRHILPSLRGKIPVASRYNNG